MLKLPEEAHIDYIDYQSELRRQQTSLKSIFLLSVSNKSIFTLNDSEKVYLVIEEFFEIRSLHNYVMTI